MKCEIIAEIAQGYEGNPKLAELLVRGAIATNADAVKIQLVLADELCVPTYPYYDFFKSLEMGESVWNDLVQRVHDAGKKIYFDVYGSGSLALARNLGADGIKISTTDFYNLPLIKQAFNDFDTVFVSTGGVPVEDIDQLLELRPRPKYLTLMHGFQAEPTETADNNLARIETMRARYSDVGVGFMDHSVGSQDDSISLPLIALGLGATCIEKHITLDYSLQIEDYISALSIDRFGEFVRLFRSLEPALGSPDLTLTDKEIAYKQRAGKVVVASNDLPKGTVLGENHLAMKRVSTTPLVGHYHRVDLLIGKTLGASVAVDGPINTGMIQ
ncbi:MAG: N-acetylneuraminate synthase family protein [Methylobacter sp.]|jgi:N,N'-diacetyllegionaminate synthase